MFVPGFISPADLLALRESGGVTRNPVGCRVPPIGIGRPLKKWEVDRFVYPSSVQCEPRVPATCLASVPRTGSPLTISPMCFAKWLNR